MIPVASGVRVWIATGHTDMRRGMHTLALMVQQTLRRDPHGGDLYVFRGRSDKLIRVLWHDGLELVVDIAPSDLRITSDCDRITSCRRRMTTSLKTMTR